jgi:hypothetical protein
MVRNHRFIVLGLTASALFAASNPTSSETAIAHAALAQLPLRFEANQGQFDPAVRYAAKNSAYSVALTAQGAMLKFPGSPKISLSLRGSNPAPEMQPLDQMAAVTDYMVGPRQDWHVGVKNYSRVRYRSVYPGVDMVFYGKGTQLEYDFVLSAGADPNAIRFEMTGAGSLSITPDGDLALDTPAGQMVQHKPVIYQDDAKTFARHAVAGRYVMLPEGLVGIQLDRYDTSQPLVIDPTITYATLMGGGATETMAGIKIRQGLLYIVGSTGAGDWVQISTDRPFNAAVDCFIEIINLSGYTLQYFSYLGGSGNDYPLGMDVDTPGFVYLAGYTGSADFPFQGNVLTGMVQGNEDLQAGNQTTTAGFLSKVDPNSAGTGNSLVFSTFLNGTLGADEVEGLAVGQNGIAYVIGTTHSADFPITANAYAASLYGPSDCFSAQVDTVNDLLLYSSFFGSEADDEGKAIAIAPNGLIYFAANSDGGQFPMAGYAYNLGNSGLYNITIGAFDLTQSGVNSLIYGTYFGGSITDEVNSIALDAHGRMLLTGFATSPDFPVTALTAVQPVNNGGGDAFVSLVDLTQPPASFVLYSTFLGGANGDVGYGVAADSGGNIYATGYTMSPDFPIANAIQPGWGGGINMFITSINPALSGKAALNYSTYIGLDNTIVGTDLAIGPDGSLYVAGYTEGYLPLLPTYTPLQSIFGGGFTDDFVMVLSPVAKGLTGVTTVLSETELRSRQHEVRPGRGATPTIKQ